MLKTKVNYKGYTVWNTSENIIMLFIPRTNVGTTHYALSFDNGETWCISNRQKIVDKKYKGNCFEAIDVCVELNKEISNEE